MLNLLTIVILELTGGFAGEFAGDPPGESLAGESVLTVNDTDVLTSVPDPDAEAPPETTFDDVIIATIILQNHFNTFCFLRRI